jgi:hemoglobin/transferrin/lactoferrin receptor protein
VILSAQKVKVIDSEDSKPIKDVAVFNNSKTKFGYTDLGGEFRIDAFGKTDIINFQHPGYENISLSMDEVIISGYRVVMIPKTFEIDEFVVSANRWEQNKEEIPNKITQIRKPSIEFTNPQTAADLIATSEEVFIQKSQLGGGSPMIRGFSTNRVLIVVDGVRMNNAIFREGNIQNIISIDPNLTESAEVIFGPGAVVYGSDAIGGVMDFHTSKPLLSTSKKVNLKVNALTRYSTANNEKTGHFDINIGGIKISSLTSLTFSKYGDLTMGSVSNNEYQRIHYADRMFNSDTTILNSNPNTQVESGYSQFNITQKVRFQPTEELDIIFASHISKSSDLPRYDRLIQYNGDQLRYGDWYYGPQEWMMHNITATWKPNRELFDAVKIVVARQDFAESRHDRKFDDNIIRETFERVAASSFNADFEKETDKLFLFYGIEYVHNNINSTARQRDIITGSISPEATRYPDGDNLYNSISLYSGIKKSFSEKVIFNTGLRYNYNRLYSTFIDKSFYNFPYSEIEVQGGAVTGAAGLVILPDSKTQVSLNLSTGFRAPNLDDVAKVFDSEPGNVVVPNPDLKAEYAYNFDLGVTRDLFDLFHIEVSGFVTLLDNAMVRRDYQLDGADSILYYDEMSNVLAIVNAGSATVWGTHFSLLVSPARNFKIKTNFNYTHGEDEEGVPLRHVSPLFGSAHIIYESKKLKTDLYAIYNGELSYKQLSPSESDKPYMYATDENGDPYSPSWYTINLKASYQLGTFGIINAGIENILNHRYRPYSSGIVSPGRNFIIALRVRI